MNKKFSTLLAGAALLGAVTANGAVKLNQGANNGLYQLKAGSAFLSITENSTTHEDEIKNGFSLFRKFRRYNVVCNG